MDRAGGMIESWIRQEQDGVVSTWHDTLTLALNVLMGAGFGKSSSFDAGEKSPGENATVVYRNALRMILDNLGMTIITSRYSLPLRFFPAKWTAVKKATMDFKHGMEDMVEDERNAIQQKGAESANLMSVLLRSSEAMENGKTRNTLTDDEIYGNLFVYNLAGHDTTANTLAYAMTLLSAEPEIQDWLREEIRAVLGPSENVEKWEYEKAFPQLKRCLAIMVKSDCPNRQIT